MIGAGHVGRCLALAQEFQERGHHCIFAAIELGGLRERIAAEGFELVDVPSTAGGLEDGAFTARLCGDLGASWLIADGYSCGEDFQRALKKTKVKTLLLDDYGQLGAWQAEIVLDQNLGAGKEQYSNISSSTQLLLGSNYVL